MRMFRSALITVAAVGILAVIGSLMNSHPSVLQAAGGPTVTIDPAQLPLQVTNDPGRKAFAFFKNDSFGSTEDGHNVSFIVPAGKRLVIESVSVNGLMD